MQMFDLDRDYSDVEEIELSSVNNRNFPSEYTEQRYNKLVSLYQKLRNLNLVEVIVEWQISALLKSRCYHPGELPLSKLMNLKIFLRPGVIP